MQEYTINGVKVKIERETNTNSKSLIDCLIELFLLREKENEDDKSKNIEEKEE